MVLPNATPPSLAPSVEEAYRRKCIQLRQRMNDVEEANAASTLRLQRMHRGIEKMRLERAFLLEQLAKRTSTNVEDSEGSPSPPPTPKEKPLRTKRGHRKPSFLQNLENGGGMTAFSTSSIAQNNNTNNAATSPSPTSESFSHTAPGTQTSIIAATSAPKARLNGDDHPSLHERPRTPKNAFELFANELRPVLISEHRQDIIDEKYDLDQELARKWQKTEDEDRKPWKERFERGDIHRADASTVERDEDVEMAEDGPER